ncbi:MAG: HAD-IA family hydrolase [Vicinamibacterales bacterium]
MATIWALLLDADGVVQLPAPAWRASLEALCGDPGRTDEFLADVFAAEKPCLISGAGFDAALAGVLAKWRSRVRVQEALRIWTQIEPDADILALVSTLRASGVAVALATNQQAYRANYMTNALGYARHFDYLLNSCELGHAKPSVGYFSSALAKIKIDPAATLFIDDHQANVAAARNSGLRAELFHVSEGVGRIRAILKRHGLG